MFTSVPAQFETATLWHPSTVGYIRAAFANLTEDKCKDAAAKLKRGLQELVNKGPSAMDPL